ncbi:universal stress protein [Halomicrobium urmianum]|uniref:universal stress protein n=1 Tax=Halomicrobium urmianum TaxID=1586233 RepID=UPI001CDA3EED|nr:universal stress protein [Halomicrobium urmianum]
MYDTILVPSDGSERASEALDVALDTAEQHGADVHALFVVDTQLYGEPALSSFELFIDEIEDQSRELLDEIVDRGAERGVTVTPEMRHGAPAESIMAYADEVDADLVVMGYQGETHRRQMGSVVEQVLDDTDRRVLVV